MCRRSRLFVPSVPPTLQGHPSPHHGSNQQTQYSRPSPIRPLRPSTLCRGHRHRRIDKHRPTSEIDLLGRGRVGQADGLILVAGGLGKDAHDVLQALVAGGSAAAGEIDADAEVKRVCVAEVVGRGHGVDEAVLPALGGFEARCLVDGLVGYEAGVGLHD